MSDVTPVWVVNSYLSRLRAVRRNVEAPLDDLRGLVSRVVSAWSAGAWRGGQAVQAESDIGAIDEAARSVSYGVEWLVDDAIHAENEWVEQGSWQVQWARGL